MKSKFTFDSGLVGLVVVLLVVIAGLFFGFRTTRTSSTEESVHSSPVSEKTEPYGDTAQTADTNPATTTEAVPQQTPDKKLITNTNNKKIMYATLHTTKGDITIEFNSETPKTVDNFIKLAKEGFYNDTKFHRVIKGFMSQGGDPLSKDDSKEALWGTGGPGYKFADELVPGNKNNAYTIAMANAGPNTNGSQFFINAANNNFLDTKHVVFGHVTVGQDVADAINSVSTDPHDRPLDPVVIQSITLK